MKSVRLLLVVCFVFGITVAAFGKTMLPISFKKGELPDDVEKVDFSLSEDNPLKADDVTLKLVMSPGGWAGVEKPKKAGWDKFKVLKINVFNPSDKTIEGFSFMIKGGKMTEGDDNRKDWIFSVKPGASVLEVKLDEEITCNDGKSKLDISRLLRWCFWNTSKQKDGEFTIFVQKMVLDDLVK